MKERPILFSGPMVRALLDGRKTQTRRLFKVFPADKTGITSPDESVERFEDGSFHYLSTGGLSGPYPCPYGAPGDRLWVRETCQAEELSRPPAERPATRKERLAYGRTTVIELDELDGFDGVRYLADGAWRKIENSPQAADLWFDLLHYGKKPPAAGKGSLVPAIHMPRWASRITLEITGVRVERLNDISEADADAEGFGGNYPDHVMPDVFPPYGGWGELTIPECYARLWEHIHGEGSWDANPWVWVVEFQRIDAPAQAQAA